MKRVTVLENKHSHARCAVIHKLTLLMMAAGKDILNLLIFIEGNGTAKNRSGGQVVFVLSFVARSDTFSKSVTSIIAPE